jgi:hypothetical protein
MHRHSALARCIHWLVVFVSACAMRRDGRGAACVCSIMGLAEMICAFMRCVYGQQGQLLS